MYCDTYKHLALPVPTKYALNLPEGERHQII